MVREDGPMALRHATHLDVSYGRVDQLSPLVRRVVCANPGPFTFLGTGTYLVGRGAVAVIDPGPELGEHLDALAAALGPDEEISHVVVTHTHTDHSAAAPRVAADAGVETWGHGPHGAVRAGDDDERVDFSAHFEPGELEELARQYEALDPALKREGADLDFVPDVRVGDGERIEGEGWTLEAVWTPGHCSNHLCWSLLEEDVLFTGDHVMAWSTTVISPPDGSMADYLASLRRLLHRHELRYWPTHGPAVDDPPTYVRALLEHREEREEQVLDGLRRGLHTIAELVPDLYAAYDKRLWYPAAASVHAHLLGLVEVGRVRVGDDAPPTVGAVYLPT